jgi:hypothetical protein
MVHMGWKNSAMLPSSLVHTNPEDGNSGLQGINTQEHSLHHCSCCEQLISHTIYIHSVQITTLQRRLQMRAGLDYFSVYASLK